MIAHYIAATSALLIAATGAWAQDFVGVAPAHSKVLLDNAKVRVIEFRAVAGDKIPMHSHPPHVAYGLSGGKAVFSFPDGSSRPAELKAGQSVYADAVTHAQEHLTDTHVLIIELKQ
jgi:quercetin dioxygenase-like cupin family protein